MAETVVRSRSELVDYVAQKWGIEVSVWTIGRILKAAGFVWKRMRRSCKPRRDEVLFRFFHEELEQLKSLEDQGEIDLFFFDEAGFSLQPVVPYAWQRVGQTQIISSTKGANQQVMGLISRKGVFRYLSQEKAFKTPDIIEFFDRFTPEKKTIIILDNAPTHTASEFKERIKQWKQKQLFIQFIPRASPELNYIEMLWRKMKYQWLPREAFLSKKNLKMHLQIILDNIGKDYQIHFA